MKHEWQSILPHNIDHVNVYILVSFRFLYLLIFRHDPRRCVLWFQRFSQSIRDSVIFLHSHAWSLPDDLRLEGIARTISQLACLSSRLRTTIDLPVDILYENFFLVHIVEIIVRSVLSTSPIQIYPLHVHVMHYPMILKKRRISSVSIHRNISLSLT